MNVTFLDKIISNDEVIPDKAPSLDTDPDAASASVITARPRILRLLEKIHDRHQLLTVEMEYDDTQYSSMILEINREEGYMVLDGFYPKLSPQADVLESRISVYTFLSGVELDFSSSIEAIAEEAGEPYYKVPLPDKLLYFQKRQFLRVPVSMGNPIKVVLSDNQSSVTRGEIRDISLGGFSARLKLAEQRFTVGDIIPKCMLYMPGDRKILCAVEIRQEEPASSTVPPKIGARFLNMSMGDQKIISKFVTETDRSLARRFLG